MEATKAAQACNCGAPEGTNFYHDAGCPETRLRAAAPDLLAACKCADETLDAMFKHWDTRPIPDDLRLAWKAHCETHDTVRAAIVKAEGR